MSLLPFFRKQLTQKNTNDKERIAFSLSYVNRPNMAWHGEGGKSRNEGTPRLESLTVICFLPQHAAPILLPSTSEYFQVCIDIYRLIPTVFPMLR